MAKTFTTDEEIINEYYRLYTELGTTQKCCDVILELSQSQSELWKSILNGLVHTLKGDGLGIVQNYDNKEEYKQAYDIFDNVRKQIKNKKGLLFLFVEKKRIDALALCFTVPIKEIEALFDNVINQFKDNKTTAIQVQVAKIMLSKSFILWKYAQLAEDNGYKEEYSNLFEKSTEETEKIISTFDTQEYIDNPEFQTTIAKAIMNKANDVDIRSDKYKQESIELRKKIVARYEKSDNKGLGRQVLRAMFDIAMGLHRRKVTAEAEIQKMMFNPTENVSAEQVIYEYNNLITECKKSTISDIQQYVIVSMLQKIAIYEDEGASSELMTSYSEIIQYFKNNEAEFSEWKSTIENVKQRKTDLQKQLKIEEEQRKKDDEYNRVKEKINVLFEFYPDNKKHLNQLIDLIRKGQIIPYIGAGLSHFKVNDKPAYPLWRGFVDDVYEKYKHFENKTDRVRKRLVDAQPPFEKRSCIDKATFLKDQLGKGIFGMEVIDTFRKKKPSEVGDSLEKQPYALLPKVFKNRFILTTNFDNLIELAYKEKESFKSCSVSDIETIEETDSNHTILYKLHGTIEQPNSIVLTREDYKERYAPDSNNSKILSKYLSGNSILFMGCSLEEDDDIMPFYKKKINYAIFPCAKDEIEDAEQKLSKKNIIPILFPLSSPIQDSDFHHIVDILKYCLFESEENENNDPYIQVLLNKAQNKMGKPILKRHLEFLTNYNPEAGNHKKHSGAEENNPPKFSDVEWENVQM